MIEVCVASVTGWAGALPATAAVDEAADLNLGGFARRGAGTTVAS